MWSRKGVGCGCWCWCCWCLRVGFSWAAVRSSLFPPLARSLSFSPSHLRLFSSRRPAVWPSSLPFHLYHQPSSRLRSNTTTAPLSPPPPTANGPLLARRPSLPLCASLAPNLPPTTKGAAPFQEPEDLPRLLLLQLHCAAIGGQLYPFLARQRPLALNLSSRFRRGFHHGSSPSRLARRHAIAPRPSQRASASRHGAAPAVVGSAAAGGDE